MGQRSGAIHALGAELVGIAVTATYAQQAFAQSLGIDYPLLSDWGGETSKAYGVQYEVWKGHAGLAKRSVFVIDRSGRVTYRWATDDAAIQPRFDEIVAQVASAAGRVAT